jgi:hypothetical protein
MTSLESCVIAIQMDALCYRNGICKRHPSSGCCKPSGFEARNYHLGLSGRAGLLRSQCDMDQPGLDAMTVAKKQDKQLY